MFNVQWCQNRGNGRELAPPGEENHTYQYDENCVSVFQAHPHGTYFPIDLMKPVHKELAKACMCSNRLHFVTAIKEYLLTWH